MSRGLNILVLKVGKLEKTLYDGRCTILNAFGFLSDAIARISVVGLNSNLVIAVTRLSTVFTGCGVFSLRIDFAS